MQSQVLELAELGIIDTSFIGLDSTPVAANTSHNNPKSFRLKKFSKDNPPKSDRDCGLGVHSASNQHNEKNYEFYWGYIDCITGLPIYVHTATSDVADSKVVLDILEIANAFLSVRECAFIADKGYDDDAAYPCRNPRYARTDGKKSRGCVKKITLPDDYRLSIDRDCISFKSVYALRTECEHYNSCFKSRLWVRNGEPAENLNSIAHIALLAFALAAVITRNDTSYRCLKSVKRIA